MFAVAIPPIPLMMTWYFMYLDAAVTFELVGFLVNCDGLNDPLLHPLPWHCCGAIRLIVESRVIDSNFSFSATEMVASRLSFFRYKVVLFLVKIHVSKSALRHKWRFKKMLLQN